MADQKDATSPPETPDSGDGAASESEPHELSKTDEAPDNGESTMADAGLAELAPTVAERETDDADLNAADLKERLLRALADMENLRRRAQREREEAAKYAMTNFARDLLTVADNLRRALESIPNDARAENEGLQSLGDGVEMTERELLNLFERYDIRRVEPTGEKFDPNYHQAMFEVPETGEPAGTVVRVMQAGYVIGDRLLRPAMVGVAKSDAGETDESDDEEGESGQRVDTTV